MENRPATGSGTCSTGSDDNFRASAEMVTAAFVFCSEADKLPLEGPAVAAEGKGNERESEEEKKRGDDPSSAPASPHSQAAAVTQ